MRFLAETCLLTHGLRSVTNEEMAAAWPFTEPCFVWMERGEIIHGTMERFLSFRANCGDAIRFDCYNLAEGLEKGLSGALTASGTMEVCRREGIPLAVTCGMGGIGDIADEKLCPDLPALHQLGVALIATSPKDVVDIPATMDYLKSHGVTVAGAPCTGYIFRSANVETAASLQDYPHSAAVETAARNGGLLLLNPILEAEREVDLTIVKKAILAGKEAEAAGRYYHPAANAEIDRLTNGHSSRIQLLSFIANIQMARDIPEN